MAIETLLKKKALFHHNDRFLSLAVRPLNQALLRVDEMPGGFLRL
jgi:hypothetical protein